MPLGNYLKIQRVKNALILKNATMKKVTVIVMHYSTIIRFMKLRQIAHFKAGLEYVRYK